MSNVKSKLQTSVAKAYDDKKVQSRGHDFEAEVAKIVADAGWTSFESLPIRQLGGSKQLGDLDVLAISRDARTWIVIECKWFGAARTPREIANWLQDLHGHDGDKLHKHLRKVAGFRPILRR